MQPNCWSWRTWKFVPPVRGRMFRQHECTERVQVADDHGVLEAGKQAAAAAQPDPAVRTQIVVAPLVWVALLDAPTPAFPDPPPRCRLHHLACPPEWPVSYRIQGRGLVAPGYRCAVRASAVLIPQNHLAALFDSGSSDRPLGDDHSDGRRPGAFRPDRDQSRPAHNGAGIVRAEADHIGHLAHLAHRTALPHNPIVSLQVARQPGAGAVASRIGTRTVGGGTAGAMIAYLSLILGELIPKHIALHRSSDVSLLTTPTLGRFATVVRPVI